uniref:Putative uncharacterized protein encoded by LINC00469 n=1 Tax=Homo sapiens TaxID=9606 RepID=CQ054_HUMAN|nr:RecName: Full=Putative uncharacterized protein encoded by LINC00469 [Homo sapiens]BAC05128.1 unnamed protein product [Homo sapiens]
MTSSAPTLPDVTIRNVSRHIQMSLMGKGEPPWLCRLQLEPLLQAMEEQQLGNLEARWEVEKHGNEVSGSTSREVWEDADFICPVLKQCTNPKLNENKNIHQAKECEKSPFLSLSPHQQWKPGLPRRNDALPTSLCLCCSEN